MIKNINYPWESINCIINKTDLNLINNYDFKSQIIGYSDCKYTSSASGAAYPSKKLTNKYKIIDLPGPTLKGDSTNKIELSIDETNRCDFIYKKSDKINREYEFFFDDVMNFILFILRDKDCLNIKSYKGETKYWSQILNKLTKHTNNDPAKYALIVDLSEISELIKPLNSITDNPNKILKRIWDQERIQKVREIDKKCLIDLARRPGSRIAEKAGPKQRIMAIKRFEDVNILENKVAKHCSELAIKASKKYIKNHYIDGITSKNSDRIKSVEKLQNECIRLPKKNVFNSVKSLTTPCKIPNYTLLQNSNYNKIWEAYNELLKNEDLRDNLWKWYKRMWSEYSGYFLAFTFKKIEHMLKIKEVGQKSIISNKKHSNGKWLISDLLPGPYIYENNTRYSTIYFINGDYDTLSHISKDLRDIAILNADYLLIKITKHSTHILPIYTILPNHTLNEKQYLEYFNNIPGTLNKNLELFNKKYNSKWKCSKPWIIGGDWKKKKNILNINEYISFTSLSSNYKNWDKDINRSSDIIKKFLTL